MKIEEYKRKVESIRGRVNYEDWVIEKIYSDLSELTRDNKVNSKHKLNVYNKISGSRYLPESISKLINKDSLPIDNLINVLLTNSSEFENWADVDNIDKYIEDIVVSVIRNDWKDSPLKYQVSLPSRNLAEKPYLYKTKDGKITIKVGDNKDNNLGLERESTLLTKEEIIKSHKDLWEFREPTDVKIKDKEWFKSRIKRVFSLSEETDWVTSQMVNDVDKLKVDNISKEELITNKITNKLPLEVTKVISNSESMDDYNSDTSSKNTEKESIINLCYYYAENELKESEEWMDDRENQVSMLTSWLVWNWTVEPFKYQFALPGLDEDGKVVCLYAEKTTLKDGSEYRKIPEYKTLTIDEFENNPLTMFTKDEFNKGEELYSHMWKFHKKVK